MERIVANSANSAHQERPIGTWNGFVVLAIGIALVASAIWELVHAITVGRPLSAGGLIGAILLFTGTLYN
jgi:hypothetical protein